jgi:hypothetical protein
MDDSLLEHHSGEFEDDNEYTTWTEYWLDGELVHRSAHVTLKRSSPIGGEISNFV